MRDLKVNLKDFYPEYDGSSGDYREAVNFIRQKFQAVFDKSKEHLGDDKPILECYNTVATDTENVKNVLRSCRKIILNEVLNALHE